MNQDGILIINKPTGMTSHDVVQKLRRAYNIKKVGHTGTLDPMVTGVMVVCFGKATKLSQFLIDEAKQYEVTMCIGISTDTEDTTGTTLKAQAINKTMSEQIKQKLPDIINSFKGEYLQTPPMYSAIKIQGKKLYEYAREQVEVERVARAIEILNIAYHPPTFNYNEATQTISCSFNVLGSKGLFARTLCVDIGEKLGFPATMEKLIRQQSGSYTLKQATDLEQILLEKPALIPIDEVVLPLKKVTVANEIAEKLKVGYRLPHYFVAEQLHEQFAVYDETTNTLIGIYQQSEKYPDKYQSVRIM